MILTTVFLVVLALVMAAVLFVRDRSLLIKGLLGSWQSLKEQLPLLLLAFALIGYLEVLLPTGIVKQYIGEESGVWGILAAGLMGAAIPAGPYIVFPLANTLALAGAGTAMLIAFLTGWMMLSLSHLPFELALLGPRFTLYRNLVFILMPLLAGLLVFFLSG